MSMCRTFSASTIALITAAGAPTAPASPAALTPTGLVVQGTCWKLQSSAGRPTGRGLPPGGGRRLALLHALSGRRAGGDAADGEEARGAGEAVGRHHVGVALHDTDTRRVDAELV